MFGSIGTPELILIFVIALLIFGPKKLPEIGRSVGKALREFKKTSEEIKSRINEEIEASEIKDIRGDIQSGADAFKAEIESAASEAAKETDDIKEPESHESGEGQKVS